MVGCISPPKAGHFINAVEQNSPAHTAGLKAGDRILTINKHKIVDTMTHTEVMAKARELPTQVCITCLHTVLGPMVRHYALQYGFRTVPKPY